MQKKWIWSRQDVPGRPGKVPGHDRTGPRDPEGPVVPWSRGPGTKKVQKSRDLKIEKVLGQWKPYSTDQLTEKYLFLPAKKKHYFLIFFDERSNFLMSLSKLELF